MHQSKSNKYFFFTIISKKISVDGWSTKKIYSNKQNLLRRYDSYKLWTKYNTFIDLYNTQNNYPKNSFRLHTHDTYIIIIQMHFQIVQNLFAAIERSKCVSLMYACVCDCILDVQQKVRHTHTQHHYCVCYIFVLYYMCGKIACSYVWV